jgi:hypothetical protein
MLFIHKVFLSFFAVVRICLHYSTSHPKNKLKQENRVLTGVLERNTLIEKHSDHCFLLAVSGQLIAISENACQDAARFDGLTMLCPECRENREEQERTWNKRN